MKWEFSSAKNKKNLNNSRVDSSKEKTEEALLEESPEVRPGGIYPF